MCAVEVACMAMAQLPPTPLFTFIYKINYKVKPENISFLGTFLCESSSVTVTTAAASHSLLYQETLLTSAKSAELTYTSHVCTRLSCNFTSALFGKRKEKKKS